MPITEDMVEAGAKALRERNMAGKITVPWERVPKSQRKKWLEQARTVLLAAALVAESR